MLELKHVHKNVQSRLNTGNKRKNRPVAVPKSPLPNAGGADAVVVGAVVVGAPNRLDNVGVELLLVAAAVAAVDVTTDAVEPNKPVPLVLEPAIYSDFVTTIVRKVSRHKFAQ